MHKILTITFFILLATVCVWFSFAFFKWKKLPEEGARIQKENIHGLFVQFYYFLPFEAI